MAANQTRASNLYTLIQLLKDRLRVLRLLALVRLAAVSLSLIIIIIIIIRTHPQKTWGSFIQKNKHIGFSIEVFLGILNQLSICWQSFLQFFLLVIAEFLVK